MEKVFHHTFGLWCHRNGCDFGYHFGDNRHNNYFHFLLTIYNGWKLLIRIIFINLKNFNNTIRKIYSENWGNYVTWRNVASYNVFVFYNFFLNLFNSNSNIKLIDAKQRKMVILNYFRHLTLFDALWRFQQIFFWPIY